MLGVFVMIPASYATYDANVIGVVTELLTYPGANQPILFHISAQPTSHPACQPYFFALPADVDVKAIYARLLLARATGESVNIGYDSQGSCVSGWIRAWRVG